MIDIRGLYLTYPGKTALVQALRGIDLHIASGEIFGIIGRSGAGKSSLVRCINLLSRPTSGNIRVNGHDVLNLNQSALRAARRDIGMVFQHFNLLGSRTVFDNVALPLELAGIARREIVQRVMSLLELVGLSALHNRYPAQISGGQKQRVGIARALANQPKVLLSDEATSALDPETTRAILALLRKINRELGLTVVLITHQMQVIKQIADRMAVIDNGQIVEAGSVLDIFSRPQQTITRSLIDEIVPQNLPESVLRYVRESNRQLKNGNQGCLLRLAYSGENAYQPILSQLIREPGLEFSILHGQIDEVAEQPFGSLAVYMRGSQTQIERAIAYLHQNSVQVQNIAVTAVDSLVESSRHD